MEMLLYFHESSRTDQPVEIRPDIKLPTESRGSGTQVFLLLDSRTILCDTVVVALAPGFDV